MAAVTYFASLALLFTPNTLWTSIALQATVAVMIVLHLKYRSLTTAWICGAVFFCAFVIGLAVGIDAQSMLPKYTLIIIVLLSLIPLIGSNFSARTSIIGLCVVTVLVILVLADFGSQSDYLASDGVPQCVHLLPTSSAGRIASKDNCMTTIELAQYGLGSLTAGWINVFQQHVLRRPSHQFQPASKYTLAIIFLAYLYLCYRILEFGKRRNVADVSIFEVNGEGEIAGRPDPQIGRVLASGAVGVGLSRDEGDESSPALPRVLSAPESAGAVVGVFYRMLRRPVLRATLYHQGRPLSETEPVKPLGRTASEAAERADQSSSLVIEELAERVVVRQSELRVEKVPCWRHDDAIRPTVAELAGYSILAYCLSSRGMPAWANWNPDGVGLALWFQARERRFSRLYGPSEEWLNLNTPVAESEINDGEKVSADLGTLAIEEEAVLLSEALDMHDPDSLLLMLEMATRLSEVQDFLGALRILWKAAAMYPQFPETWLRLSIAYMGLASEIGAVNISGGAQNSLIADNTIDKWRPLWDETAIGTAASCGSYRSWYNRSIALLECESDGHRHVGMMGLTGCAAWHEKRVGQLIDGSISVAERLMLRESCLLTAAAVARRCNALTFRPRMATRCVFVQSERVYFYRLLMSRYGVRRISMAARSAEVLAFAMLAVQGADGTYDDEVMRRVRRVYHGVIRDGTGWRSCAYLSVACRYLAMSGQLSRLQASEKDSQDFVSDRVQRWTNVASGPDTIESMWHRVEVLTERAEARSRFDHRISHRYLDPTLAVLQADADRPAGDW